MIQLRKSLLLGLAAVALTVACQKNNKDIPGEIVAPGEEETPAEEENLVTIYANLPNDGLELAKASISPRSHNQVVLIDDFGDLEEEPDTKVSLVQDTENVKVLKPCWENGDVIRVTDKASTSVELTLTSGAGSTGGVFVGEGSLGDAPYTIELVSNKHMPADFNNQTQASDGSTAHLGYDFVMTGATCYGQDPQHAIQFTKEWADANSATISNQPSVLRLRAMMPPSISSAVKKVIFRSSAAVFNGQKTLTVNLITPGVTSGDDILDVYATLPYNASSPAISDLLVQFQVSDNAYDKYSFYATLNSGSTVSGGCTHVVNIACTNIENNANRQVKSGGMFVPAAIVGTADFPYYIADQHQLYAMRGYLPGDSTLKYYKLLDDIDMTGVTYGTSPTAFNINFNGNSKTVSNLDGSLFTNFGGSVNNLTIEDSTSEYGMLAKLVDGSGSAISNVSVVDCTVSGGINEVGGMIGKINGASSTITNCSVSGTDVDGGGKVGGVIGDVEEALTVSGCSYTDGTIEYVSGLTYSGEKYFGGMVGFIGGYIENFEVIFSDCSVTGDVTIDLLARTGDSRSGGFVGQNCTSGTIKGCSVGTSSKKVLLKTNSPEPDANVHYKPINVGGFVGVNYGTITKDGSTRNESHVQITSNNTYTDKEVNLGGFCGFHRGTIEYSDAYADLTGLKGQYIGGFCGRLIDDESYSTLSRYNTVTATVAGNSIVGGYAGGVNKEPTQTYTPNITVTNCQVLSGTTVSGDDYLGGFAGQVFFAATFSGCIVQSGITVGSSGSGNHHGGFVGKADSGTYESNCIANADVLGSTFLGGFTGISQSTATFNNCHANGPVTGYASVGGFVGRVNSSGPSFTSCSASGTISATGYYVGGFVGDVGHSSSFTGCSYTGSSVTCSRSGVANRACLGGFAGRNYDSSVSFTNCTVSAPNNTAVTVNATNDTQNVGGFVGETNDGTFRGNTARANVTGGNCTGGFTGWANGSGSFSSCMSYSTVSSIGTKVGGFVGEAAGGFSFDGCRYEGTSVTTSYAGNNSTPDNYQACLGGFAGAVGSDTDPFTGLIRDCHVQPASSINVKSTTASDKPSCIGGFVGRIGAPTNSRADNTGSVTYCHVHNVQTEGSKNVGGFAGLSYVSISKCYSDNGGATATLTNCGGLVGYQQYKPIQYCYSTYTVLCENTIENVGGLVGTAHNTTLSESFSKNNASTITGKAGYTGGVVGALLDSSTGTKLISWWTNRPTAALECIGLKDGSSTESDNYYKPYLTDGTRYMSAVMGNNNWSSANDGTWVHNGVWNISTLAPYSAE